MESKTAFYESLTELIVLIVKNMEDLVVTEAGLWSNSRWSTINMKAFEIAYCVEGSKLVTIDNSVYNIKKGDFYLTDLSYRYSSEDSFFKLYYIAITGKSNELYLKIKSCFKNLSGYIQSINHPDFEIDFIELYSEYSLKKPFKDNIVKCMLINILVKYYRYYSISPNQDSKKMFSHKYERFAHQIIHYLNENYNNKITLKDLSKKYSLSERYLNIIFKNATNSTIIEYLIKLRVNKSKRFLSFTSISITDIAYEMGFCDCQHFCKTFKLIEGITPSEFRNKLY